MGQVRDRDDEDVGSTMCSPPKGEKSQGCFHLTFQGLIFRFLSQCLARKYDLGVHSAWIIALSID